MCVWRARFKLSNSNNRTGKGSGLRFLERQPQSTILLLIPALFCLSNVAALTVGLPTFHENVRENIQEEIPQDLEPKNALHSSTTDLSSKFRSLHFNNTSPLDYVIVHPARVDHDGRVLSHDVRYFNRGPQQKFQFRRKRAVDADQKETHLYFLLNLEGKNLTLDLNENQLFVRPSFIVERFQQKKKKYEKGKNKFPHEKSFVKSSSPWPCHFRGHVTGHPRSVVAISTCNGLSGIIRLQESDYMIEPLTTLSSNGNTEKRQPHRIYKRNAQAQFDLNREDLSSPSRFKGENQEPDSWENSGRKRTGKTQRKKTVDDSQSKAEKAHPSKENTATEIERQFCGVVDTKLQYHKALHSRRLWEARRATSQPPRTSSTRHRRSLSLEHWVEMMVVVDKKMADHYEAIQEGETERYVLTIINMVSELFHDVSVGNAIHITLVRLVILDEEEDESMVTAHAEKTLDNFCRWAKRMNPSSDAHPNHHDVAVLLTRRNICSNSNTSCETLGLAHVAGMCQSRRSCSVNQDTGLSLAYTVAHELGHNFAMHHDGRMNDCEPDDQQPKVMAPRLTSNNLPLRWSPCSRRYITRFLDRNWGFCLMDVPSSEHEHFDFPNELPGVLYDADHQCRLMFGSVSKQCGSIETSCSRLWCTYKGNCRTKLHAAVPGTKCGIGKWCHSGACVEIGRLPPAINGSWSPWSRWSKCSRTCGVGVTVSARYCNQPAPRHGGSYCLGERKRYKTCNVWSCPITNETVSFRAEQCSEFNSVLYKNRTFSWLPVNSQVYPCELHCYTSDNEHPFADRLRDKVVDGTKCFSTGRDICVDGICKRIGCDFKIDSMAEEDKCGSCRGNGLSCSTVNTTFDLAKGEEYVYVGLLPKGATKIEITEAGPSGNFLALRNPMKKSEFYLNGNYKIQWDIHFDLAGTVFHYQRMNRTLDNITADGPITHDIAVMLLFVETNPGVTISYIMPHNVTAVFEEQLPQFQWMMQPWSPCSQTCGRGFQISLAICVERKSGVVEEDFCDVTTRPDDKRRICLYPKCQPEWYSGPWQPCSVSCGGDTGHQKRDVLCVRSVKDDEQVVLSKARCKVAAKPETRRSCTAGYQNPCPMWRTGDWGNCSRSCGGGNQTRSVTCVTYVSHDVIVIDDDTEHSDDEYSAFLSDGQNQEVDAAGEKPSSVRTGRESAKSRSEINRLENVDYDFVDSGSCDVRTQPASSQPCNTAGCDVSPSSQPPSSIVSHHDSLLHGQILDAKANLTHFDKDFDVNDDLDVDYSPIFERKDPADGEDLLDIANPSFDDHHTNSDGFNIRGSDTSTIRSTTTSTPVTFTLTPRWLTGLWGQCSTTCGIGAQIRNVLCSPQAGACQMLAKPAPAQRCNLKPCAKWQYGSWTKCSQMCGKGHKRRKIQCRDSSRHTSMRPFHCASIPKLPELNTTCNMHGCQPWKTSRWTMCSASCGMGIQRRRVLCSKSGLCDLSTKPVSRKKCMKKICVEWSVSHWGRCPVNCGIGIKRRLVKCVEKDDGKPSTACDPRLKPVRAKKCNKGPCRVTDYDFSSCVGDRLKPRFCQVLKQWGKCVQPSLAIQCCRTCKTFVSSRRKDKIS